MRSFNTADLLREYLAVAYPNTPALVISGACYESQTLCESLAKRLADIGAGSYYALLEALSNKDFVFVEADESVADCIMCEYSSFANIFRWNPKGDVCFE